jgi:hypothetical protein
LALARGRVNSSRWTLPMGAEMRFLTTLKLSCLLLLCAASVPGQNQNPSSTAKRKFEHHADIIAAYDQSKDQTAVVMQWYAVDWPSGVDLYRTGTALEREQYELKIQAAFAFPGRVIKSTPQRVQFEIRTRHLGKAFFKGPAMPELIATVDGQQISLGPTQLVKTNTFVDVDVGQVSYEHVSAYFTNDGLLRLIGAKKVTMKAGGLEFVLQAQHLEALRDLASRMAP